MDFAMRNLPPGSTGPVSVIMALFERVGGSIFPCKRLSLCGFYTTYGVKPGKYAGIVQSEVNMDELFG
jgi:hypothetical protein